MKKTLKIIFIVGVSLLIVGSVIFFIALGAAGGNLLSFSNVRLEEKRFDESAENPIDDIVIDFENAKIEVRTGNVSALSVEYPQAQNKNGENLSQITLTETDGALSITERYAKSPSFNLTSPIIVLHLPSERTYELSLTTKNGEISFSGDTLQAENVRVRSNNGALRLSKITAATLTAETDNGEVKLDACNVSGNVALETNNGKITLLGDILANNLTAETDNGEIQAQNAVLCAQSISLDTNVGSVYATLAGKKSDYAITIENNLGDANIQTQSGGSKMLSVHSDVGSIYIYFQE